MRRVILISSAFAAAGACAIFPSPDSRHLYACKTDADCAAAMQVCVAGQCEPRGAVDAGDAGPPDAGADAGDAGMETEPDAGPDAGDAGVAGYQDGGIASLTVALVSGGDLISLTSGMDDGAAYAVGTSLWRLAVGSSAALTVNDRGDALADAVEKGQLAQVGYRPLLYGEAGGDQFAAISRHNFMTGDDDIGIFMAPQGKWHEIASFPTLRTWALVDDSNLGPLVYALVVADGGNELIEIDQDGGQTNVVPPPDAGWACSALTGQPDSGTLFVGLTDQGSLQTTALAIDNLDGGPTIDLLLPLGVIPMPNPGGCRQIGPMAFAEFNGESRHSPSLLFWDGTYGIGTLESIDLFAGQTPSPLEAFDGGPPLSLTVANDLGFVVASEGPFLSGNALTSGIRFTPGPFFNDISTQINFLASTSAAVLASTSTGLYDVTILAAIDGGGVPVPADTSLYGQAPFGYAAGPHALLAFAGSDHSTPTLLQDNGLGFTPFASPVGAGCTSQTPIADNETIVVCDGGTAYQVNGKKAVPLGTAPGLLLAQDAPDGGIWLYTQTSPVQVGDFDGGFTAITGSQPPVFGSPLGADFEATYAFDNTGGLVTLNGPNKKATPVAGTVPFSGAGLVDPTNGNVFVGADSKGVVWSCGTSILGPATVACAALCAAADPIVDLAFQVVIPKGQVANLWILSRESVPAGSELAVLPPGLSHLAYLNFGDLLRAGQIVPTPACPLVTLTYPDPNAPEALIGIATAPFPMLGVLGSVYVQGSRHLLTLSR